jgi:tetratricopeptide (TPR) repeat protein
MTGLVDRLERELDAARTVRPRDSVRYAAVLERALRACDADWEVADALDPADLYLELATEYQAMSRWDDALAAADAAVDAGLDMHPDPRCLRAEILMRAGRAGQAEPIWAAVRADTPDDVWLYNTAGLEYADTGDHRTALDWLTDGLRLALRTSDPERLVDQLADLRQASLDSLGQPADALQEQAMEFLRAQVQARQQRSARAEQLAPEPTGGAIDSVALAWLPAGDYQQAVTLWPDFAGSARVAGPDGPLPHPQYCQTLQKILVEYTDTGTPGLVIAPVRVTPFTEWCAEGGHQPDSAGARAEYAAHLAAERDPALIAWPPGRNQPCWCGSGRKYKKCCAATISDDMEAHR